MRLVHMFETEPLSIKIDFWRRDARIYRLLKVRHEVIIERMGDQRILERM